MDWIKGSSMYVYRQDDFYILTMEAGNVKIKWDNHTNIYITLHSSIYFGKVGGLCGNADSNRQNDLLGSDNVISFGNSFKEPSVSTLYMDKYVWNK